MNHDPNLRAGDWHEDVHSNPGVMTNRWWIGVAVVVIVIAAAIGVGAWMSNPVNEPTTAETEWLAHLDDAGIDYGTKAQGVEMARAACDLYEADGPEAASGILDLFDEAGYGLSDMAVLALSVTDAC